MYRKTVDAKDDYWGMANQLAKVEEWCKKTAEAYSKREEGLAVKVEPISELKEETKYKCTKCKKAIVLNMLLTCGFHQLCFNCATEVLYEKIWTSGGWDIDSRIECDDCNKTVLVEKMLLKECRCVVDCVAMREKHKIPFEFGKKCKSSADKV